MQNTPFSLSYVIQENSGTIRQPEFFINRRREKQCNRYKSSVSAVVAVLFLTVGTACFAGRAVFVGAAVSGAVFSGRLRIGAVSIALSGACGIHSVFGSCISSAEITGFVFIFIIFGHFRGPPVHKISCSLMLILLHLLITQSIMPKSWLIIHEFILLFFPIYIIIFDVKRIYPSKIFFT